MRVVKLVCSKSICVSLPHVCVCVRRFIELDEGESVESVTQHDIVQVVDVTSAQKVQLPSVICISVTHFVSVNIVAM